jgi:4-amino-4-deoxy-L-arabinose transferase-like glycosyltransferase
LQEKKRWLIWIAALGLGLRLLAWLYFCGHLLAMVTSRLPDDALYYFTIARNLAHGHGITFDGVHPTNGMHPLWLFIIAPFFWASLTKWGYIHAVLLFQSILDAAIVWLIGSTVYDALPNAKPSNRITAAAASAMFYAASFIVIVRSINGLETTVTAFLLVLWLRIYLQTLSENSGNRAWALAGIVTGLLLLARTDSFIILIPLTVHALQTRARAEWKKMLLALVIAVVIVSPWVVWNIVQFGTPLQSSAEAVPILAMRKYNALYGASYLKFWHLSIEALRNALKPFWYAAFGLPLLTIAFAIFSRRKTISSPERSVYFLVLGGVLLLVIHSMFRGFIREWYVEALLPIFLIAFGISMGANSGKTEARASGRWLLVAIVLVLQIIFYRTPQMRSQQAVVFTGVPLVQELTRPEYGKPPVHVAALNSGYYSYFAQPGSVVDLDGVVSPEAVSYIKQGDLHGYLDRDSVSYILDFEGDFGGYVNLIDRHLLDSFVSERLIWQPGHLDPLILYRRRSIPGDSLLPYTE